MTPEDERHGKPAGYRAHQRDGEVVCGPCRAAHNRYERYRKYDEQLGKPRVMPTLGVQRRVRALQRLGWSGRAIATVAGYSSDRHLQHALSKDSCHRKTWLAVARAYDELSMKFPPERTTSEKWSASRVRNYAERMGWPPPLAWTDIDDPDERPRGIRGVADEADVEDWLNRILSGERPPARAVPRATRFALVAMWPSTGLSMNELERRTGWKPERYRKDAA